MMKYSRWGLVVMCVALAQPQAFSAEGEVSSISKPAEKAVKPGYARLFKKVAPAVVSLYAMRLERDPFPFALFGFGPLDRFDMPTRQRISQSIGSGCIVTEDGLVVTNSHVIHGAHEIKAVTYDGREFEMKVVLEESEFDLAILRMQVPQGETFAHLEMGNSDHAEPGDVVLAMGNPFGLSHTLTQGIISAVGRSHQVGMNPAQSYIQADAVINMGNSGGPLFSPEGELLGICTFIISRTGGSDGLGFAIPSNMLRPLVKAAQEGDQQVVRPWLGIEGQTITADIAKSIGLKQSGGVMVTRLQKESPADKAGLKVGDALVKVDGDILRDEGSLSAKVNTATLGQEMSFDVLTKKGDRRSVQVTLVAPPAIEEAETYKVTLAGPLKGVTLADLSPGVAAKLRMAGGAGVVIMAIASDSTAHAFGLKEGDVIENIQGKPVKDIAQVKRLLSKSKATRTWQLSLKRGNQSISLSFSH